MNEYLQAYSFAPFAVVLALCFAFTLFWLPETQGTTPEELQDQLTRKHSQTTYHNMDVVQSSVYSPINQEWKEAMEQIRKSEEADMVEGRYSESFYPKSSLSTTIPSSYTLFLNNHHFN